MSQSVVLYDLNKAAAELCRRKLSYFVKEFWDIVVPNDLVWNWHLDVMCDELQQIQERVFKSEKKEYDAIFNVPPGSSKTMIISVLGTAWEFARKHDIKSFVGSYSDAAVLGISDNIRLVMKSEKYRTFFPEVRIRKDFDTKHEFKTETNGHFYGFTVGGTITSKHADMLKIDDPLNPLMAMSKAESEKIIFFFDKTLPTRKVNKEVTPTVVVVQRLGVKDPTGHILEQKASEIRHICLPGEISDHVKPAELKLKYVNGLLDPVRLSRSALAELKKKLGSDGYSGQIMQRPVPDGGLIWQKWFIEVDDAIFPSMERAQNLGTDWDLAYTKDDTNAASAYITSGKIGSNIYIFDFGWEWLEFPELIKYMRTKTGPHYIEAKASGKSAKQTLSKMGIISIEIKVKGGADKVARARMATPLAESGVVYIKKSMANRFYNDEKQGILFFPKGQCADLADTLAQTMQRQQSQRTIITSKPEEHESDNPLDWIN